MYIEELWIENFRSIRSARLPGLRPFNIFYGPNGAGKSNVLKAIEVFVYLVGKVSGSSSGLAWGEERDGHWAIANPWLRETDFWIYSPGCRIRLGAILRGEGRPLYVQTVLGNAVTIDRLLVEVEARRMGPDQTQVRGTRLVALDSGGTQQTSLGDLWLRGDAADATAVRLCPALLNSQPNDRNRAATELSDGLSAFLTNRVRPALFNLIPAVRSLLHETRTVSTEAEAEAKVGRGKPRSEQEWIALLLADCRLKEALYEAKNSPSREIRRGYEKLRRVLEGEPLKRPRFDPVRYSQTGTLDIQEDLPEGQIALSLDHVGLGVQQLYVILASVLLSGSAAVGLEEPEAHLHGPSSGVNLRKLLRRTVEEGHVKQLFIATHSNLFDLDPEGFWDVSFDVETGTQVRRETRLIRLHERHVWEPGPALAALLDMLKIVEDDEVVFRAVGGRGITARQMIDLLLADDPIAFDYLKDVTAAAVRAVQIRAEGPES